MFFSLGNLMVTRSFGVSVLNIKMSDRIHPSLWTSFRGFDTIDNCQSSPSFRGQGTPNNICHGNGGYVVC